MTDSPIVASRRVWMDTETTGLSIQRRAWDVALIVRQPAEITDDEYQWFVHPIDIELERADWQALQIGRFWERHPHGQILAELGVRNALEAGALRMLDTFDWRRLPSLPNVHRAYHVADKVDFLTRDKSLIYGSNPGFDMLTLEHMLNEAGRAPKWHYHPNDVPNLIEGYLRGLMSAGVKTNLLPQSRKSDDWCRAVGIEPNNYERHSALGDCRLFRDAFDAMNGGER